MDTKERLIEASLELILDKGFHATSMRDIADKLNMSQGGLYNHFKDKDEIYSAIINKYHPWLLIPKIVKKANGDTFDSFVQDAIKKEQKQLKKNEKIIRLHFIELVEFNGIHLPDIFENAFDLMVSVLQEKEKQNPDVFGQRSIPHLSRALLGLFFSYMINDPMIMGSEGMHSALNGFEYFNDIYLQGIISNFNSNSKED